MVFPGAVGPEEAKALSGRHFEIDARDDFKRAIKTCAAPAPPGVSSRVGLHDPSDDLQLAMEEMIRPGHHDYRQLLRPRPVEHRGEGHGVVVLAVDHEGTGRHGRRLEARDADADQHQPLGLNFLCRRACSDAPKENPARTSFAGSRRLRMAQVLELASALIVHALGLADAAEIRPPGLVAQVDEGARKRLHDLVVKRAAEERVRVRDERDAARGAFGTVDSAFDTPAGPAMNSRRVLGRITS